MELFCAQNWTFLCMHTRVQNGVLCTQEYKAYFIVEAVEVFSFCF